jgi:flagellar hook-length control protein FliK
VPETPRPESVRESVLRIVDKVSVKAAEGKYDFDIDLKPDFMGKVSIKLTMEDGAVKVHIRADDAAVKGMLQDQTSSLQSMLKEKGIPVSNIDVTYEGSQAQGNEGHARNGEGRQHQSNLFREQAENGSYESARERYDFYLGNSSIEYLA